MEVSYYGKHQQSVEKLAEVVVKFVTTHIEQESIFSTPEPQKYMTDPYGLLKLVEVAGVDATTIDRWMCEAQGAKPGKCDNTDKKGPQEGGS